MFAAAQLLPGDLGRSVLGRDASAEAVAEYNHEHGTDRAAVVQYLDWAGGVARGDFGNSLVPPEQPVWDVIRPALAELAEARPLRVRPRRAVRDPRGRSLGLRAGKATDRGITVVGLSLAVVPEFVTGLVLILVFSIWAGLAAGHRPVGAGLRATHAGGASDAARDRADARAVRLRRPHHSRRSRRGARRRLHANGVSQGTCRARR